MPEFMGDDAEGIVPVGQRPDEAALRHVALPEAARSYVLGALGDRSPTRALAVEDRSGWVAVRVVDPGVAVPRGRRIEPGSRDAPEPPGLPEQAAGACETGARACETGAGAHRSPEAALVTQWPSRRSGAEVRRFLRRIRAELWDDGVLVTHLKAAPAGAVCTLAHEVASSLRGAGFGVERIDSDLKPGLPPSPVSTSLQVVARPLRMPPRSLAVASWRTPAHVRLDLRYAPDEAPLLDPAPSRVWEEVIAAVGGGADLVASYAVDDPYGGERGAEVVGRHFGCPVATGDVTFAAGVTSLLHDLADLADGGVVAAPQLVHADLEAWVVARGGDVVAIGEPATPERLVTALEDVRPALLHLDRPTFTGHLLGLDELEVVLTRAARVGSVVLIDESAAPYAGPRASAVVLAHRVPNLVVLRGFTKAYSWGGLRGGFAVSSGEMSGRVRELVAPLQIGELALRAALQLLELGDVFGRLRERIRERKPVVAEMLAALGLEVLDGHPDLPWIALPDAGGVASRLLGDCGIAPLFPTPSPTAPCVPPSVLRITIPFSEPRLALFRSLLRRPAGRDRPAGEMTPQTRAVLASRNGGGNG